MRLSFHLLLFADYPDSVCSPPQFAYDISYQTNFQTQLHGGFSVATVTIYDNRLEIKRLFDILLGYHAIIVDRHYRVVYEGRVTNVSAVEFELQLSLTGYYAEGGQVIDDRIYTTSTIYMYTVIQDAIDLVTGWRRRDANYYSADYNLAVTDPDGGTFALDFTDLKVQDALERCLAYGYSASDTRLPYFAIWEGRYADLVVKENLTTSTPNWRIVRENVHSSPPTYGQELTEVYNQIYAIYANEGEGNSKTTAATDANSISRFGLREGVVQNGGNPEGLAIGEDLRDLALEQYAWPQISSTITVEGMIETWFGAIEDNYMIRAGDIIYVDLGDPNSIIFPNTSPEVAAKTKMFVFATNYNAQSNTNSLTIGKTDRDFTVLMSRLGLSGGLR